MGVFKLGKMTFGSLFKKPETILYPIQQKPQPSGLKGHISIDVDACILCGMCDRSCATGCITVSKPERYWEIDRFQCVQCGYCITVCPKKCLHMDPNYAPAATERAADRFAVPEQGATGGDAKPASTKVPAEAPKIVAGKPAASAQPEAAQGEPDAKQPDAVLEAKIALLDEDKAEKVRAALAARK